MSSVGIIANPASGKDIRRIIASGMVVTNQEKANIIIRMIMGMDAFGVDDIYIMPDSTHIGERVIAEVTPDLKRIRLHMLEMPYILGTFKDSKRATEQMVAMGLDCIMVLGGDGTSRIVAQSSGLTPIVPVSTGTNNVFPQMVEGTIAGMAAAAIATGNVPVTEGCFRAPVLELRGKDRELIDTALVDLAVVNSRDLGAKAVWESDSLMELFLTSANPSDIGLSSIGGWLMPMEARTQAGLHIKLGGHGELEVTAPIAPGLIQRMKIDQSRKFEAGELVEITRKPGVIALDGEREVLLRDEEYMTVNLSQEGPMVVDLDKTLMIAASNKNSSADKRNEKVK